MVLFLRLSCPDQSNSEVGGKKVRFCKISVAFLGQALLKLGNEKTIVSSTHRLHWRVAIKSLWAVIRQVVSDMHSEDSKWRSNQLQLSLDVGWNKWRDDLR